jgi:hypothetical protein
MNETTEQATTNAQPVSDGTVPVQWCSWHHAMTEALAIRRIAQGPAAGGTLYACRDCRRRHGLLTLRQSRAWADVLDHLGGTATARPCGPCNRYNYCDAGKPLRAELRAAHVEARR